VIHPVGLGAKTGTLPFVADVPGNLGSAHFQEQESDETIFLDVVRGDSYIIELGIKDIDFIKIDVEGFELEVLQGLRKTIERYRPILTFEYHAQDFNDDHFYGFLDVLVGYTLVELVFAPAKASFIDKLAFNYVKCGMP